MKNKVILEGDYTFSVLPTKGISFSNIHFIGSVTINNFSADTFNKVFKNCDFASLCIYGKDLEITKDLFSKSKIDNLEVRNLRSVDENFLKGKQLKSLFLSLPSENVYLSNKFLSKTKVESLTLTSHQDFFERSFICEDGFLSKQNIQNLSLNNCVFLGKALTKCTIKRVNASNLTINNKFMAGSNVESLSLYECSVDANAFSTALIQSLEASCIEKIGPKFLKKQFNSKQPINLSFGVWKKYEDFKYLNGKIIDKLSFGLIYSGTENHLKGTVINTFCTTLKHTVSKPSSPKTFTLTRFKQNALIHMRYIDRLDLDIHTEGFDNGYCVYRDGYLKGYSDKKTIGEFTIYKLYNHPWRYNNAYLVSFNHNGVVVSSHDVSIKEALKNINRKLSWNRFSDEILSKYKVDDKLTKDQCIELYKEVTNACTRGVEYFLEKTVLPVKEFYTIKEIEQHTRGEFGSDRFSKYVEAVEKKRDKIEGPLEAFNKASASLVQ